MGCKLLQSKAIAVENDLRATLRNFGLKVGMVGTVKHRRMRSPASRIAFFCWKRGNAFQPRFRRLRHR